MREERHAEALREVLDTINAALSDARGLLPHQRRLMAMISLGVQHLVELYFHRLKIIKPGAQVKHNWFKAEERRVKLRLKPIITKALENVPKANEIIATAREIELDRDEIVYGMPLDDDRPLREKVDLFLELKKTIEERGSEG